jgi:hypothetical protein
MKIEPSSASAHLPAENLDLSTTARYTSVNEVRTDEYDLFTNLSPRLLKNLKLLRLRARYYVAIGKPEFGLRLLETAIRNGGWLKAGLWWELVATMGHSDDYHIVRRLWLSTPEKCHNDTSILRAVARAACISDSHGESRTLLRRAALVTSSAAKGRSILSRVRASATRRMSRVGKKTSFSGISEDATFSRVAAEALLDLNQAFSRLGLKAFLISGTLLGLIREGRIIGWDKDIDVGVFSEDCPPDLEDFFRRHERFHLGRVDLTTDRLRVIHANGTWIDIFPHYKEGDKLWHDGSATRWWNSPFSLKTMNFLGVEQYVPDDPELYLDENYGDWRTPSVNFDARLDAPNVQVADKEHFITLLFFSLDSSIRKNNNVMKRRYVQLLREIGEGSWLDRL